MQRNEFTVELSSDEAEVIKRLLGNAQEAAADMVNATTDYHEGAAATALLSLANSWKRGFQTPVGSQSWEKLRAWDAPDIGEESEDAFVDRLHGIGVACAAYPDRDEVRMHVFRGIDGADMWEILALNDTIKAEAYKEPDLKPGARFPFNPTAFFGDDYDAIAATAANGVSDKDRRRIAALAEKESVLGGAHREYAIRHACARAEAYCRERVVDACADRIRTACERARDAIGCETRRSGRTAAYKVLQAISEASPPPSPSR